MHGGVCLVQGFARPRLVAVVAKAVIAIRVSIERAGRNDSAFGKRLGYREREGEKREAVAVADDDSEYLHTLEIMVEQQQ